jgi:hypothetical protein
MTEEERKVNEIDEALEKERNDYSTKMSSLISMINKIDQIPEAQVLMLSYRHMMVEKLAKYRAAVYKKKSNDQNYRKVRYEYYKLQHDVRLDYREINQFIDSDMALRTRQTELLDNQINFFAECVDTLDKMGFAIRNRISIEEFHQKNY